MARLDECYVSEDTANTLRLEHGDSFPGDHLIAEWTIRDEAPTLADFVAAAEGHICQAWRTP